MSLHQVHGEDGGRIRYERKCEVCGKVVDYADIDKAYEEGGATVVLTGEDLKSLPVERSREIEVVEFVPSEQIDPVRFDRSYFLEPDANAAKAYALLLETLKETDRTAVVQFSLRQKTRLGALRAYGDVMMLQSLLWDDEVREADFDAVKKPPKVSANEKKMASSLVENMSRGLRARPLHRRLPGAAPHARRGQARAGRRARHGGDVRRGGRRPRSTADVIDLVEALRRSVEANRQKRAGSGVVLVDDGAGEEDGPRRRPPKKKAPAKKAPAKKKAAGQEGGGQEVGLTGPRRPRP